MEIERPQRALDVRRPLALEEAPALALRQAVHIAVPSGLQQTLGITQSPATQPLFGMGS
jgi:hypothetical protein